MKVGILTIYGGSNFGNKLQNYALQQFLKSENIESETIRYTVSLGKNELTKKERTKLLKKKYFSQGILEAFWNMKLIAGAKLFKAQLNQKVKERNCKFEHFEKQNIALSDMIIQSREELQNYCGKYDAVIVGSDQVWNPYWQGSLDEFFLDFVPKQKRIAYAPSIGVADIPVEQQERFRTRLNGFNQLSCREIQGCKLIENLTGNKCEHVCDPVFLLSPVQWKDKTNPTKGNFIVTYFLGGQSWKSHQEIERYATKKHFDIIDLWSEKDYTSSYAGVEEFLNHIAGAKILFTDSFHGCAFAILLNTQFVICERKAVDDKQKMNSRLDSLMEILDIHGRKLEEFIIAPTTINYDEVYTRLQTWVQQSREYLRACLVDVLWEKEKNTKT